MNKSGIPENSGAKALINLIITTLASVLIIVLILFTGILPIRLEIDSTRLTERLDKPSLSAITGGLSGANVLDKASGVGKVAENMVSQTVVNADIQSDGLLPELQDAVMVVIPPKQQLNYRLEMKQDYALNYSWKTDGKSLYTELRGERKDAKAGASKIFSKSTSDKAHGFFITPFSGHFGWYWDNKTDQAITVTLSIKGAYKILGIVG